MAENKETRHTHPDLSKPEMRHEHADVNVWAIGKLAIALILVTIASVFLMFGVFRFLEVRENALQPPPSPVVSLDSRKQPPEPRLLQNEPENLQEMRAAEDQLLNSYGWADGEHKAVRIPIDRAMDLLLQRGLPSRLQPTTKSAKGPSK